MRRRLMCNEEQIAEKRALAAKTTLTEGERVRLRELDEQLYPLDVRLTKEQQERQKAMAREVLERLSEHEPSAKAREIASKLFEKWDTALGTYEETTNDLVTAIARALDAAVAKGRGEGNVPTVYREVGGIVYCVWGTSSIDYVQVLEAERDALCHELAEAKNLSQLWYDQYQKAVDDYSKLLAEARAALKEYGEHQMHCPAYSGYGDVCRCGFTATLAKIEPTDGDRS